MFPKENLNDEASLPSVLSNDGCGRRAFLAGLTATVASFALSGQSHAGLFGSRKAPELPASWKRRFGKNVVDYAKYLDRLRLKHITVQQVIAPHLKRKRGVQNTLPPRRYWKKMKRTLRAADALSAKLGLRPREIISAYRSPAYNRACSGAHSKSYHMQNVAIDITYGVSPYTVARAARDLRSRGKFKGGVGRYSGFTHLDTRGYNADW